MQIFFSTDAIATDDEEKEPPIRRKWDDWDDKVNAQEGWSMEDKVNSKEAFGPRVLDEEDTEEDIPLHPASPIGQSHRRKTS